MDADNALDILEHAKLFNCGYLIAACQLFTTILFAYG